MSKDLRFFGIEDGKRQLGLGKQPATGQEGCLDAYTDHPQAQPRIQSQTEFRPDFLKKSMAFQKKGISGVFDNTQVIKLDKLDAHKKAQSGRTAVVTTGKMGLGSKRHEEKVKREFALDSKKQDTSRMDVDSDLDSDLDADMDLDSD